MSQGDVEVLPDVHDPPVVEVAREDLALSGDRVDAGPLIDPGLGLAEHAFREPFREGRGCPLLEDEPFGIDPARLDVDPPADRVDRDDVGRDWGGVAQKEC